MHKVEGFTLIGNPENSNFTAIENSRAQPKPNGLNLQTRMMEKRDTPEARGLATIMLLKLFGFLGLKQNTPFGVKEKCK